MALMCIHGTTRGCRRYCARFVTQVMPCLTLIMMFIHKGKKSGTPGCCTTCCLMTWLWLWLSFFPTLPVGFSAGLIHLTRFIHEGAQGGLWGDEITPNMMASGRFWLYDGVGELVGV